MRPTPHPTTAAALRSYLADRGHHPPRDPGEFSARAVIEGMTPGHLGADRCAALLARLCRVTHDATDGDGLVIVERNADGERVGYAVLTNDQVVSDMIADAFCALVAA